MVLILWIICVIVVLCLKCIRVCSLLPCGHPTGKGRPLSSCLWCLLWFCYFLIWYPVTGVVLDCIDFWSLLSFLLWWKWAGLKLNMERNKSQETETALWIFFVIFDGCVSEKFAVSTIKLYIIEICKTHQCEIMTSDYFNTRSAA